MDELKTRELIESSLAGNKSSLEALIRSIQDKVYSLCLRMIWQQEDAQEATQECLLKIITHLGQFRSESKFETWVYRITANHLIDRKRAGAYEKSLSFIEFESDLLSDQTELTEEEKHGPDYPLQIKEVRIACTTALLSCLDEDHRLAYILGEILELDHKEAGEILTITSSAFRKRLERSREKIEAFTSRVCGVMSKNNPCQCERRINYAKSCGRLNLKNYPFSNSSTERKEIIAYINKLEESKRTVEHYRASKLFKSPVDFVKNNLSHILY